jgi:hypothetical protein
MFSYFSLLSIPTLITQSHILPFWIIVTLSLLPSHQFQMSLLQKSPPIWIFPTGQVMLCCAWGCKITCVRVCVCVCVCVWFLKSSKACFSWFTV